MKPTRSSVRRLCLIGALGLMATACSGLGSRTADQVSLSGQSQGSGASAPGTGNGAQAPAQGLPDQPQASTPANPQAGGASQQAPAAPGGGSGTVAPATGGHANGAAAGGKVHPGAGGPGGIVPAPPVGGPDSQGVASDKIKIGVLMPISGAVGFLGEAGLAGVRAGFELANSQGGAHGRQFQLIVVDTQFEPTVEALGAKRLVEQDKVFAIVNVIGDSSAPYITSKGIPEAAIGVGPAIFSSHYPNIYPFCCNVIQMSADWAWELTQVMKLPIKSTAILYDTQNIPIQQWLPYLVKGWQIWGVDVKSTDSFNISDGDCTAIVLKMRSLNIDYWNMGQSLGWPLCGQAMARQQYKPPLGFGGAYTPDAFFIAQAGPGVDGVYGDNMGPQIQNPATFGQPYEWDASGKAPEAQAYVDSVKKYSPHNADYRSLESAWTQIYWVGAKLIVDAIRAQSGSITWQGVNSWIQSQKDWRSGLLSPMNFDPKCKTAAQVYAYQWHWDGTQFVQTDWHKYADPNKLQPDGQPWSHWHMPVEAENKIIPGAGDCLATALADAVIKG